VLLLNLSNVSRQLAQTDCQNISHSVERLFSVDRHPATQLLSTIPSWVKWTLYAFSDTVLLLRVKRLNIV